MSFFGSCPQCGKEIPQEHINMGIAICDCGWFDKTSNRKATKALEKTAIKTLVAVSVAIAGLFVHTANWGSYSFSIPVVKIQQLTGTLSKAGHIELAEACLQLGKLECAQEAYLGLYQSKHEVDGLARLGKLNLSVGDNSGAIAAYKAFFQAGGNTSEAALNFGRALENAGNNEDALKYFEAAIASSGERLPVQATTGVIRILMKQGKYDIALERVQAFHDSAENAKGYLNTELTQLETYMDSQAKASKAKKAAKRVARI